MSALHILHIEDNPDDGLLVDRALRKGGLDVSVERVDSRDACGEALLSRPPDAVIVGVNLPGWDVGAAIALVRGQGLDVPVIVVSGTVGEEVTVARMRAGAHDVVMQAGAIADHRHLVVKYGQGYALGRPAELPPAA